MARAAPAYDPKLDRKVALKLLAGLADEGTEGARQGLQRERSRRTSDPSWNAS